MARASKDCAIHPKKMKPSRFPIGMISFSALLNTPDKLLHRLGKAHIQRLHCFAETVELGFVRLCYDTTGCAHQCFRRTFPFLPELPLVKGGFPCARENQLPVIWIQRQDLVQRDPADELGFRQTHNKAENVDIEFSAHRMKNESGFHVDLVEFPMIPQTYTAIRINVDDYEEAYDFFMSRGFRESKIAPPSTTASSKYAYLVSPTGVIIDVCEHIKK